MPIRRNLVPYALAAALVVGGNAPSFAFDPTTIVEGESGVQHVLRYGYDALKQGRHQDALNAFKHNADQNHVHSQWKLARMLQLGHGVERNPLEAYKIFGKIADRFSQHPPNRAERPFVSSAVVELGHFELTGIEGTSVRRDVSMAEIHFNRAAVLYGNADAQYRLGKLYSGKALGNPNPVRAARWFKRASRKGHMEAQARFGEMLFNGEGVRKDRVLGLVYLSRATSGKAKRATSKRLKRLRMLRRQAFSIASKSQKQAAEKMLSKLNIVISGEESPIGAEGSRAFSLDAKTPSQ